MEDVRKILEENGLSRNEVKVYLACVNLGPSMTAEIRKKTALPESTAKDNLGFLMKKGLVNRTFLKNKNRNQYSAEDPQRLADQLKQQLARTQSILPGLRALKGSGRKHIKNSRPVLV